MRALLVANPKATATTPRGRDVLVGALGSDLKIDVAETASRGHAAELAREAVAAELDLVVVLGGDGTINEVVNGLLADGPKDGLPALAVVPGGSANVFPRALGLPRDPVEATGELLAAIRERRSRSIGVGRADERWFTCAAGVGFDAEVVRAVEQRRADGHAATPWLYVRAAVHQFLAESDRRHPALRLERPDEPPVEPLAMAIVSNTAPWTYFGSRPVQPSPEASFETGLDVMAMRRLRTGATLRAVRRMLISGAEPPQGRHVLRMHDLPEFALKCQRPMAVQVDGDYVGERESVTFRAYRDALRVVV